MFRKRHARFGAPQRLSKIEAANPIAAVAESGRMILAWPGDAHVEARVRSADGRLLPAQRVTHDRLENSMPAVLAHRRGLVAWIDRGRGVSFARVAYATSSGTFRKAPPVARARHLEDPPRFISSPRGLLYVRSFGHPGRSLLETQRVPLF